MQNGDNPFPECGRHIFRVKLLVLGRAWGESYYFIRGNSVTSLDGMMSPLPNMLKRGNDGCLWQSYLPNTKDQGWFNKWWFITDGFWTTRLFRFWAKVISLRGGVQFQLKHTISLMTFNYWIIWPMCLQPKESTQHKYSYKCLFWGVFLFIIYIWDHLHVWKSKERLFWWHWGY